MPTTQNQERREISTQNIYIYISIKLIKTNIN